MGSVGGEVSGTCLRDLSYGGSTDGVCLRSVEVGTLCVHSATKEIASAVSRDLAVDFQKETDQFA